MKTKVIALSAISASFIAIILAVSAIPGISEFLDLSAPLIAPVFLSLPLYVNSKKGAFLAYLAGGIIALLLGFNIFNLVFILYFPFFGIYPIVKYHFKMCGKDKLLFKLICMLWFVATGYLAYFYYTGICKLPLDMIIPLDPWQLYIFIGVGLCVLYFLVDAFTLAWQTLCFRFLSKFIKIK